MEEAYDHWRSSARCNEAARLLLSFSNWMSTFVPRLAGVLKYFILMRKSTSTKNPWAISSVSIRLRKSYHFLIVVTLVSLILSFILDLHFSHPRFELMIKIRHNCSNSEEKWINARNKPKFLYLNIRISAIKRFCDARSLTKLLSNDL